MRELTEGTIIRNLGSGQAYVVESNDGKQITAVRTIVVSNPSEWEVVTSQPPYEGNPE